MIWGVTQLYISQTNGANYLVPSNQQMYVLICGLLQRGNTLLVNTPELYGIIEGYKVM